MPYLERSTARIYYELLSADAVSAPIVTLVNGHTRSSGDFRMMARHLNAAGISCVILDNRASGKSEASASFSLDDMQNDVVAVWDALRIEKSNLLGISMGGFICQGLAIHRSERVASLALVSTAADPKWIRPTGGGWISSGSMVEEKLASYFAPGFVENNPILFETMVKQTKMAIAGGNFSERSNMQRDALAGVSWADKLHLIKAKTMIIHGAEDQVVDVEAARQLVKAIHNADIQILPGIGHLILAEAPKTLYQIATSFFLG